MFNPLRQARQYEFLPEALGQDKKEDLKDARH